MITGDKEWFCARVSDFSDSMYRIALGILRNPEDAGDALQETLYTAYMSLGTLSGTDKFKPWIMRILINKSKDILRQRARSREFSTDFDTDTLSFAASEADDGKTVDNLWLMSAIDRLDAPSKTAVMLYYFDGMSIKEISLATGATQSAVKVRLSRARQKLKKLLAGDGR